MFRSWFRISFLAILLIVSVIAPNGVGAATAPAVAALAPIDAVGFDAPIKLAVDGSGNVYAADRNAKAVIKFDQYGRKRTTYSVPGFTEEGIAVTADGTRLYVSAGLSVRIVDGVTGQSLGSFGEGYFERVGEIALDETGFVFVGDRKKCQVAVYSPNGEQQYVFGSRGTADGQFMDVAALTVDVAGRQVLVADTVYSNSISSGVSIFTYDGVFVRKLPATSALSPVSPPANDGVTQFGGIAVDVAGRLYFPSITSVQAASIRILGPDYVYLSRYNSPAVGDIGGLAQPTDAVFDAATGRLLVANSNMGRIEVFGIDGATSPVFVNHAPSVPLPLSPVDGSEVVVAKPELSWQNATDVDDDALSYNVQVFKGTTLVEARTVAGQAGVSSACTLLTALEENQAYTWSVRATDGTAQSAYSEDKSFVVNAKQEAPLTFVLFSPANLEVVSGLTPFVWQKSIDSDPEDVVTYRLQVAADDTFATVLAATETTSLSANLASLAGYQALEDGSNYFWRVVAVDNHGLETASSVRQFIYDTTQLTVTANVPGAVVSFGGNLAYAGQRAGTTPLEVRDLAVGSVTVVVERSGFEPWVSQVAIGEKQNVAIRAELQPALNPRPFVAEFLAWGKDAKRLGLIGGNASLFAVDFDNDGLVDILAGDSAGSLTLYRGAASETLPAFATREVLPLTAAAGAAPFVVDWNNDGRKDLVIGSNTGAVSLYLNNGTDAKPTFAAAALLQAAGDNLSVASYAVPAVMDLDGDGDKDLVVANGAGAVTGYLNTGTDAAPVLAEGQLLLPLLVGRLGLTTADWNADGRRDLVVVSGTTISVYVANGDGTFKTPALSFAPTKTAAISIVAADLDGAGGKDLLLGLESGSVKLLRATGTTPLYQFTKAMKDVVVYLETVAAEQAVVLPAPVAAIDAALVANDLAAARAAALDLAGVVTGDATVDLLLGELAQLLR